MPNHFIHCDLAECFPSCLNLIFGCSLSDRVRHSVFSSAFKYKIVDGQLQAFSHLLEMFWNTIISWLLQIEHLLFLKPKSFETLTTIHITNYVYLILRTLNHLAITLILIFIIKDLHIIYCTLSQCTMLKQQGLFISHMDDWLP